MDQHGALPVQVLKWAPPKQRIAEKGRYLWWEHGVPLFSLLVLTVLFTWPMLPNFTTHLPGESYDAYNGLWVMWHVKEAVLGSQPLLDLPLLYYPEGASLLTHVPGPVTGFFALPFWPWGPLAAHNGAVVVSFVLTGYFMYLLARSVGLARGPAFFSGLMLFLAPMHLAGLRGHTTKVFLGAIPLVLLCLLRVLQPDRSGRQGVLWAIATAVALLLTLLHHSLQFILLALSIPFFAVAAFVSVPEEKRPWLLRRLLLLVLAIAVIAGPLLLSTARAARDPLLSFDRNLDSYTFQPDAIEYLLPSTESVLLGGVTWQVAERFGFRPTIETTVSLSWVGLGLAAAALVRGGRRARLWALFSGTWILLSLGPVLKLLGRTNFSEYSLQLPLPYVLLTALPGLDFLRTPGRLMQIAFVGFALLAALGLDTLLRRAPAKARATLVVAILLVIVEAFPGSHTLMQLRPVPAFYHQIAADEGKYGVLDLPVTPDPEVAIDPYSAHYQTYQMVHEKGIANGYISRTYESHPLFPCLYDEWEERTDVLVNGAPSACPFHPLYDLPRYGYRYIVAHKPQTAYADYRLGSAGAQSTSAFIEKYLGGAQPLYDDYLATVYAMPGTANPTSLPLAVDLSSNWHAREGDGAQSWRWARSPP